MRKIKEVLRLYFEHQQPIRQIALGCNIARSTVADYLYRAEQAGITWPLRPEMDDAALENRLFLPQVPIAPEKRQMPPWSIFTRNAKKGRNPDAPLA
jgi:DNA-binding transcriptional regulator LsrR (DeoR family)